MLVAQVSSLTTRSRSSSAEPSANSTLALPYGAAPNVAGDHISADVDLEIPTVPKPVSLKDRITHQESMICSFLSEHTLPLSVAPHLIELA